MYKIQVHYKSNIKGVYSNEIETAIDTSQLYIAKMKMIDRWFHIICYHIDFSKYHNVILESARLIKKDNSCYSEELNNLKIDLINQTLENMNKFDELITGEKTTEETKRQFKLTVEEI